MHYELDSLTLATMIRQQRADRTLREVADELGDVSASTVHRLESGKWPDMGVFLRICRWLNARPDQFFRPVPDSGATEPTAPVSYSQGQIIHLIRTDSTLAPVVANVLKALVTGAYKTNQQP